MTIWLCALIAHLALTNVILLALLLRQGGKVKRMKDELDYFNEVET